MLEPTFGKSFTEVVSAAWKVPSGDHLCCVIPAEATQSLTGDAVEVDQCHVKSWM